MKKICMVLLLGVFIIMTGAAQTWEESAGEETPVVTDAEIFPVEEAPAVEVPFETSSTEEESAPADFPPIPDPVPAAPPAPAIQPVPRPAPPARQPVTENRPPARVVPALPSAGSGQVWQVQIGAYTVLENAQDAFERAKNAGFSPVYERYARVYRVILPSVQSADIPALARKLGAAGFSEIWLREK